VDRWLRTAGRWLIGTLPPAEFGSDAPPDWVADIRVTCLPPGRLYSFRLQLWPDRGEVLGSVCWGLLPFVRSAVPGSGGPPAESAASCGSWPRGRSASRPRGHRCW
jgi:hypothetical protein